MNKRILFSIRILVSAGLLFAIFKFIPYNQLISVYKNSEKAYILLGIAVFFLAMALGIVRWIFLLSSLGIRVRFRDAFYSFFSGLFFNLFFPSVIAGDIFRGVSISYCYGEPKKIASSVVMDRFSGIFALNALALFSFIGARNLNFAFAVCLSLIVFSTLTLFLFLVIFSRRFFGIFAGILRKKPFLKQRLVNFHDQLYFFRRNPVIFIKTVLLSLFIHALVIFGFFIISKAFGLSIGIIYFIVLIPIIIVISLIPITVAGAGTREAATVYFFSLIGVEESISLSISLIRLACWVIMGILGGIIYVSVYHRRLRSHSQD